MTEKPGCLAGNQCDLWRFPRCAGNGFKWKTEPVAQAPVNEGERKGLRQQENGREYD